MQSQLGLSELSTSSAASLGFACYAPAVLIHMVNGIVQVVNLVTSRVVRIIGKVENTERFLRVALYQVSTQYHPEMSPNISSVSPKSPTRPQLPQGASNVPRPCPVSPAHPPAHQTAGHGVASIV